MPERVCALRRPGASVMAIGTVAEIRDARRAGAARVAWARAQHLPGMPVPPRYPPENLGLQVLGWIEGDADTAEAWRSRAPFSARRASRRAIGGHVWVIATPELLEAIRSGWHRWDGADAAELGVAPLKARAPRVPHLARRRATGTTDPGRTQ